MLKEENGQMNLECLSEETEEEKAINEDAALFLGMMALGIYRDMPEDYWEKEGIGWK